jgi:hypothetical protein
MKLKVFKHNTISKKYAAFLENGNERLYLHIEGKESHFLSLDKKNYDRNLEALSSNGNISESNYEEMMRESYWAVKHIVLAFFLKIAISRCYLPTIKPSITEGNRICYYYSICAMREKVQFLYESRFMGEIFSTYEDALEEALIWALDQYYIRQKFQATRDNDNEQHTKNTGATNL